ncbi:MAG: peroxide stress protein YaaA [Burkholderiaceae bacterium]|nr:peroxide stress protein YaaA [Microbacteriaceae bacterium]
MLVLLPPSETKRDGGVESSRLNLRLLGYPRLRAARVAALSATKDLSADVAAMSAAMKLSPAQHFEVLRNRRIRSSPVMPALDRYTGVLYDALDASTLGSRAREFAGRTVVIHSALFGLIRALDPIPAYRVSHDSRLPGIRLRAHWSEAISRELADHAGLVLDLRSEAYAHLGPVPDGAYFLRVVSIGPDGRARALNHFNKKGKGEFVRALLDAAIDHDSVESLLDWASATGVRLVRGAPGELELTVDAIVAGVRRASQA